MMAKLRLRAKRPEAVQSPADLALGSRSMVLLGIKAPRHWRSPHWQARAVRIIGALALVALVAYASGGLWLPKIGGWLALPAMTNLRHADAIVVHGGNPTRTAYGAGLFRRGLAPALWLTGYTIDQPNAPNVIKGEGVPIQSFRFLVTTSTWSDGHEIAAAIRAQKLHSVIIVTDWWHSRRALCSTEQQLGGYDVAIELAPSPSPAGPADWWRNAEIRHDVLSELVKFVYYAVRYGMNPWGC